jgi:L-rhamnose isomerase
MLCAEQLKTMPFPAVWERYCAEQGVPAEDAAWFGTVQAYERDVLSGRV